VEDEDCNVEWDYWGGGETGPKEARDVEYITPIRGDWYSFILFPIL
jgi:hypothetical protein